MHKGKRRYARLVNIIIAVLCIAIVFIGFQVSTKIIKLNKSDDIDQSEIEKKEIVSVFSNIETKEGKKIKNIQSEINKLNINDWLLQVIIKSNAYMECFTNMQLLEDNKCHNIFANSFLRMLKAEEYFKLQLPAIFNIVDSTSVFGDKYKEIKNNEEKNSPIMLEDIVFIEDPEESDKGEIIENNIDEQNIDVVALPDPKDIELIKIDKEQPYVLIYHTHGTEAFLPIKENQFHTTERKYNVTSIGDIITDNLVKSEHNVEHIDIYHDIPSYNKSYYRSLATAKDILAKNKNIKIIFDIHRDGVDEDASYIEKAKKEAKVNINGEDIATFSMVIGNENLNKEQLINFAKYIKLVSDKMYPGLCKGIIIKPYGRFNQYLSNHYVLLEVGSNLNTIDEAKKSAKFISNVLNNVINQILK